MFSPARESAAAMNQQARLAETGGLAARGGEINVAIAPLGQHGETRHAG